MGNPRFEIGAQKCSAFFMTRNILAWRTKKDWRCFLDSRCPRNLEIIQNRLHPNCRAEPLRTFSSFVRCDSFHYFRSQVLAWSNSFTLFLENMSCFSRNLFAGVSFAFVRKNFSARPFCFARFSKRVFDTLIVFAKGFSKILHGVFEISDETDNDDEDKAISNDSKDD
jgi:hypothetical protein